MSQEKVRVQIPASSANLGPGFDVLGLALEIRNFLSIGESSSRGDEVVIEGEGEETLSVGTENLALRAVDRLYQHLAMERPAVSLRMKNDIPLARGLGSSSAAIVGGLWAANLFSGAGLTKEEVFPLAVDLEGHPDNVAAALFGGLTVSYKEDSVYKASRMLPRSDLEVLLIVPGYELSTEAARRALPSSLTYEDAVFNISRGCLLIGLLLGEETLPTRVPFEDRLHQPYRSPLVPGFADLLEICHRSGALGAALSGAGPTIITLVTSEMAESVQKEVAAGLAEMPGGRSAYRLIRTGIDLEGVRGRLGKNC